jgi:WD40 repeat protein
MVSAEMGLLALSTGHLAAVSTAPALKVHSLLQVHCLPSGAPAPIVALAASTARCITSSAAGDIVCTAVRPQGVLTVEQRLGHPERSLVGGLQLRADQQVVAFSTDAHVLLWDLRDHSAGSKPTATHQLYSGAAADVTCVAAHPEDPRLLAVGTATGTLSFVDMADGSPRMLHAISAHGHPLTSVAFHPHFPSFLWSMDCSGLCHMWDFGLHSSDRLTRLGNYRTDAARTPHVRSLAASGVCVMVCVRVCVSLSLHLCVRVSWSTSDLPLFLSEF